MPTLPRRAPLLAPVLLAAAGLAACVPSADREQLEADLARLEAEAEKGRHLERKLPELEREIAHLDAQLVQLERLTAESEADARAKLQAALAASGLGGARVTPLELAWNGYAQVARFSVELTLPAGELTGALDRLTRRPLVVRIADLAVSWSERGAVAQARFTAEVAVVDSPR